MTHQAPECASPRPARHRRFRKNRRWKGGSRRGFARFSPPVRRSRHPGRMQRAASRLTRLGTPAPRMQRAASRLTRLGTPAPRGSRQRAGARQPSNVTPRRRSLNSMVSYVKQSHESRVTKQRAGEVALTGHRTGDRRGSDFIDSSPRRLQPIRDSRASQATRTMHKPTVRK